MARMGRPAKRDNTMSEDKFFAVLSKKVNYLPENTVRDVYFGVTQIIKEEIRKGNGLWLPDFGGFTLTTHGSKHGGVRKIGQLYFRTSVPLKKYINAFLD